MLGEGRIEDAARHILEGCHGQAAEAGAVQELATGMLHYLLTRAMVPSQRKVEYRGIQVDVVVPDLATLGSDPAGALVVCVLPDDPAGAAARVAEMESIQPVAGNVWLVRRGAGGGTGHREFVVSGDGGTFAGIVPEIAGFAGPSRLGVVGDQASGPRSSPASKTPASPGSARSTPGTEPSTGTSSSPSRSRRSPPGS